MFAQEVSLVADSGGLSQAVALSTTSAQTAVLNCNYVLVELTAAGFYRQGANPTALSDGTDQYLAANVKYRVNITPGNKLAFKLATGTGTAYVTPGAL